MSLLFKSLWVKFILYSQNILINTGLERGIKHVYVHVWILMHIHKHTHDYTKARTSALCKLYLKCSVLYLLPSLVNIIIMEIEKNQTWEKQWHYNLRIHLLPNVSWIFKAEPICLPQPHTLYFHIVSGSKTQMPLDACSSSIFPKVINPTSENASTSPYPHSLLHLSFPSHSINGFSLPVALSPYAVLSKVGPTWPLSRRKRRSLLM